MSATIEQPASTVNGDEEKNQSKPFIDMPIIPEIGLIYPPPEVRNIIDKTAEFVFKNGMEFEDKIKQREAQNSKFSFLNRNDPYFMYYKHILYEFTLYPNRDKASSKPLFVPPQAVDSKAQTSKVKSSIKKRKMLIDITDITCPTTPLQQFEFFIDVPSMLPSDLDIVKITAQFAAKNGRQFLQGLMQREMKNYIFDFLKPQHNIYGYFSKLVAQYTKILSVPPDFINSLKMESQSMAAVLDKVKLRYEWVSYNDKERRKNADGGDKEKSIQSLIDWHEFVVVETISFREDETTNLPPPVSLEQLGSRLLAQERHEKLKTSDLLINGEQEKPKEVEIVKQEPPISIKNNDLKIEIKLDEVRPKSGEKMLVSPITGELIPADKMDAHLKQCLLDPRYKEQKNKYLEEKRQQDLMASTGPSITTHLKDLAQRRSDIFGPGNEETVIGRKLDEKEDHFVKRSAPVHFEQKVPPSQPVFRPQLAPLSNDRQFENIQPVRPPKQPSQTYVPPPQQPRAPYFPPQAGAAPPVYLPPPMPCFAPDDRPTFDEPLIPEEDFLRIYGGTPINIQVRIPFIPDLSQKHGWQLQGQIEHLTVSLGDLVSSLKLQIQKIIGMPPSRQKILFGANRFGKDACTLAYYNVHSNTYIALQLKDRGGKR